MIRYSRLLRSVLALLVLCSSLPAIARDASVGSPKRGNARFYEKHASFLRRAAEGPVGALFLGDSITEGWAKFPEIWESAWGKYQPANFGIGGDQTHHVIWRIERGELDKVSPKVVVLMIGTNNTGYDAAVEIAAADRKIVRLIQEALPETKILLLAVFPRGLRIRGNGESDGWEMRMEKIRAINADLATLDNGDTIRYLDLTPQFTVDDGSIPESIMPDQLHLSAEGYRLWVEGMAPLLAEMME